jgi:hypothetical protein
VHSFLGQGAYLSKLAGRRARDFRPTRRGVDDRGGAIAGGLLKPVSLTDLFAGAGLQLTAIALSCMRSPALRSIGAKRPAAAATG